MPYLKYLLFGVAAVSPAFAVPPALILNQRSSFDALMSHLEETIMFRNNATGIMTPVPIESTGTHSIAGDIANSTTQISRREPKPMEQPLQLEDTEKWDIETLESKMAEICNEYLDPRLPKPDCSLWAISAAVEESHTKRTKKITFKVARNRHLHYDLDLTQIQWVDVKKRDVKTAKSAEKEGKGHGGMIPTDLSPTTTAARIWEGVITVHSTPVQVNTVGPASSVPTVA